MKPYIRATKCLRAGWWLRGAFTILFAGIALAQAPTGLTVKSATNTQVQLAWDGTASNYTVQRAPVGGAFVNVATIAATSYTDNTIDAYLDYTYQVIAGTSGSAVSNQVTVGPPPAGLSNSAPAPILGATPAPGYGYNISLVLDGNGDPAYAFVWSDPNNKQQYDLTQLMFRSWNRAQAAWNPVVKVAVVGDIASSGHASISLAYDASTNTFALATEDDQDTIQFYLSTNNGTTWTLKNEFNYNNSSVGPAGSPSLAARGGNFYLVFNVNGQGLTYTSGKLSGTPSSWLTKIAPQLSGMSLARNDLSPSLALDSAGNPAVAYYANYTNSTGYTALLYWQPSTGGAPRIETVTKDTVTSSSYVKMVFNGLNPRIAMGATFANEPPGASVEFTRSDNGGTSWQGNTVIPLDGNSGSDYPFDMAVNSKNAGAVAFGVNGVIGTLPCGNPKLSRSTDLVNWTTCSIPNIDTKGYNLYPDSIAMTFGGNDKLLLFWFNTGTSPVDAGIIMYREPPDNQPSGPVLSNVQDAESARTTIVAGEWVAIYGANMSATTRAWNTLDFTQGDTLPTVLSGVSVTFNGLPAAVYFISPTQIDVQAPAGLSGPVSVVVTNNGAVSAPFTSTAVPNAPSLFFYAASGKYYPAAVFNSDGTLVGDPALTGVYSRKAMPGDWILFYVNGVAASPSCKIIASAITYPSPITISFGSTMVTPGWTGLVGAGEYQMNVQIPYGLAAGDYPIVITTGGASSPNSVVLPVGP
jgi:uncharacterized protein (TIGR03437 family)